MSVFEVHYWPTVGRILMIHIPAGTSHGPILTDLRIQHGRSYVGAPWLADATMISALALAAAGLPAGEVFIHGENGATMQLATDSMRVTDAYPPINYTRAGIDRPRNRQAA